MANELNIGLSTGRTITARLILGGAYVGTAITCTEAPASSGHYSGDVPGGTGAGHYSVLFLEGSTIVGNGSLVWDGTAERTELTTPTVTELEARTLVAANYFDPATDAVATVTSITNAVVLPSIPTDWITAAGLATDAVAEIQTGGGGMAQETLDAIAAILGHTSYIANAVEAGDIETDTSGLLTSTAYIDSLPTNFGALGINASGHISRVTLVDTNTDMRGTDGAITTLGTNAPTNWINAAAIATDAVAEIQSGLATSTSIAAIPTNPLLTTDARLNNLDATISSRSTYGGTDTTGTTTLLDRLTNARAGYLDKLNVSGTLAHSDAAATYRTDVSGLLTSASYTASLPTNFADLAITAITGLVTTSNPGTGATAAEVWGYAGRTLDGAQATALVDILEDTSTTIPGLIAALPTLAQVQAAGFTTTRHNALIDMEAYTRPMAKQLGLVSGISAIHSPAAIVVSDGDGSTTITDNGGGSYTVALT